MLKILTFVIYLKTLNIIELPCLGPEKSSFEISRWTM